MTTSFPHIPVATYAGDVTPQVAWQAAQAGQATIVDVRTPEEFRFVGSVPGSVLVPWSSGVEMERNAQFVEQLKAQFSLDEPLLLLCRSARRSVSAAEAATQAGFTQVFNILEGFEGDKDAQGHRGTLQGWRFLGLPWVQD